MAKKQNQELDKKPLEELKDLPVDQTLERLGTSPEGLSKEEVEKRLQEYGYNELEEKRESPILLFLSFFRGTIPYMIMAAALISGILHHIPTLVIILVLLFLNAIIGFREEHQAGNAIEALKEKLAVKANVRRQGKWMNIEARELVPGDIVRLRIGSVIPADAKLLEGDPVKVDQAALTGESMPVEHKTGDMVYSGSILKQGEIDAVVLATGVNTYFGKTAQLVESAKTKSHLQIAIMKMADYLLVAAIVLSIVIIAFEYMRTAQILAVLQFVLVLIVAAVPVAMPAVLSVTMALGAGKLAEEQAVVTKLSAVEEMAGVDILCSDYYPAALLHAVFKLHREHGVPLHESVNLVSLNPARALGIDADFGSVEEGKKADLVLIDISGERPAVTKVFVDGVAVSEIRYRRPAAEA